MITAMLAQPHPLAGRGPELLSSDSKASLYAASYNSIRCLAARELMVKSQEAQSIDAAGHKVIKNFSLSASPLQSLSTFCVNRSGTHAVLAGASKQDSHYTVLLLVELAMYQSANQTSGSTDTPSHTVHPTLFQSRPGLTIWQVSWHPGSDSHFAVLTNDSFWRLYHTDDLTVAEQTFELHLSPDRRLGINLDEDAEGSRQHAVGFAFGAAHAWERFMVFFACSDGSLFSLCPVAPFHAAMSLSAVDQLVEISRCSANDTEHSTTQAWLDQALPRPANRAVSRRSPAQQQASQGVSMNSLIQSLVTVQPHALDNHVPALCGPLQGDLAGASSSGAAVHDDAAAAVLTCRYANACSAMVVGTADGVVQTFVVAGEVTPTWAQQPPACITQGRRLTAIRSEVPVVAPSTDIFVMRDVMQLPNASAQQQVQSQAAASGLRLQLHADPSAADRLYAVHAHGAHAVTLPWLPILASGLAPSSSGMDPSEDQLDLLPAVAEELWRPLHQGQTMVSAAPLGSSLQAAGLLVMDSQSRAHCIRPSRLSSPDQDLDDPLGLAENGKGIEAGSILFGSVLKGPEQIAAPAVPAGPTGIGKLVPFPFNFQSRQVLVTTVRHESLGRPLTPAPGNPEGQKWLTDSMNHMRRKHVQFGSAAHHDIMHNIQELQRAAVQQQQQLEELQDRLTGLQENQAGLDKRIQDASQFRDNLTARLQLLGQLHMKLPEDLNAAEQQLRDSDLPELDQQTQLLKKQIQTLIVRAKAAQQWEAESPAGQMSLSSPPHGHSLPPQQLGKARRAMETQQEGILKCQQKLALLMSVTGEG